MGNSAAVSAAVAFDRRRTNANSTNIIPRKLAIGTSRVTIGPAPSLGADDPRKERRQRRREIDAIVHRAPDVGQRRKVREQNGEDLVVPERLRRGADRDE